MNTFKQIFRDHWSDFKSSNPAYDDDLYDQAVYKMLGCCDSANGYAEYRCITCGCGSRKVPFTCKGALCLSCGQVYSDGVVAQVSKMLHPGIIYRHVVLTVPAQLREFFYKNRKSPELYSELMKLAYCCMEDVVSTAVNQNVKIGVIVVIHTHGRKGSYNPHIHIIMTDGGVNVSTEQWVDLGYFPYKIIHKKWQYHLLNMMKNSVGNSINKLVDLLWEKYPNGFVGYVSKGDAPKHAKGLAKYLAKYVASPPISLKRIINYTGTEVTYWYQDHKTKQRKIETVDVETFIGRMVQHILPKGHQRIRYYGLQATKTFKRWHEVIKEGLKKLRKVVKNAYQVIANKTYRQRYSESSGKDPLECEHCGETMELWRIWHPKYGLLYDLESGGRLAF